MSIFYTHSVTLYEDDVFPFLENYVNILFYHVTCSVLSVLVILLTRGPLLVQGVQLFIVQVPIHTL
jgi:hypothetical protein